MEDFFPKNCMVAFYNPMEGIVSLGLARALIFWPHLILAPMVKVS